MHLWLDNLGIGWLTYDDHSEVPNGGLHGAPGPEVFPGEMDTKFGNRAEGKY